jgi:hypothetical protein
VVQAQQEVNAAQALFKATDGQVGVEPGVMMPWHTIVSECWKVASHYYLEKSVQADT